MKSFAKLGLLLALVIVGRYFRPSEYTTLPAQEKASVSLVKPDTLHFATYATAQPDLVAPVSQRSGKPKPAEAADSSPVWY